MADGTLGVLMLTGITLAAVMLGLFVTLVRLLSIMKSLRDEIRSAVAGDSQHTPRPTAR